MKTYNRSLDYVALAMAAGRNGSVERAAKLFAKAIAAPDAVRAVAILEASNKEAFALQAAAKVATAAAEKKVVKAAKKVVAEFDMGDESDIDDLVGDDDADVEVDVDVDADDDEDEVEASAEDDDEGDEEAFDEQFAAVLSSLAKPKAKAVKAAKAK